MSLLTLLIVLVIFGVLLYLFNVYVTMIDAKVKKLINIVVIGALVLYVLWAFGLLPLGDVKVPRVR
jgi:hypothetical protein